MLGHLAASELGIACFDGRDNGFMLLKDLFDRPGAVVIPGIREVLAQLLHQGRQEHAEQLVAGRLGQKKMELEVQFCQDSGHVGVFAHLLAEPAQLLAFLRGGSHRGQCGDLHLQHAADLGQPHVNSVLVEQLQV